MGERVIVRQPRLPLSYALWAFSGTGNDSAIAASGCNGAASPYQRKPRERKRVGAAYIELSLFLPFAPLRLSLRPAPRVHLALVHRPPACYQAAAFRTRGGNACLRSSPGDHEGGSPYEG